MPDNILKGTIKIDAPDLNQVASEVAQSTKKMGDAFKQTGESAKGIGDTIKKSFTDASGGMSDFANKAEREGKRAGAAVYYARDAALDLGHVVRDIPYAVNNLGMLAGPFDRIMTNFGLVKESAGGLKEALATIGTTLIGPTGLIIGAELAVSLLTTFGAKLFEGGNEADHAAAEIENFTDSIDAGKKSLEDFNAQIDKLGRLGNINIKIAGLPDSLGKQGDVLDIDQKRYAVIQQRDAQDAANKNFQALIDKRTDSGDKPDDDEVTKMRAALKKGLDAVEDYNKQIGQLDIDRQIAGREVILQKKKEDEEALKDLQEAHKKELAEEKKHQRKMEQAEKETYERMKALRTEKIVFTPPDKTNPDGIDNGFKKNPIYDEYFAKVLGNQKPVTIPIAIDTSKWKDGFVGFMKDLQDAQMISTGVKETLAPAFEDMFKAIEQGKNPMMAFFQGLEQSILQLIEKLAAATAVAAILKAVLSTGQLTSLFGGTGTFGSVLKGVMGFSSGGEVPGSGNTDSVPALLTPGEYVLTKDQYSQFKGFLAGGGATAPKLSGPSVKGINIPSGAIPSANYGAASSMKASPVHITVGGELVGRGNDLVTVINRVSQTRGRSF